MYTIVTVFTIFTVIAAVAFYWLNIRADRGSAFSSVIGSLIIVLATFSMGFGFTAIISNLSINGQLTYKEFWNGFETDAQKKEVTCTRDGFCVNTFQCDPYTVVTTDSDGDTKTETKYHDCPYSQQETSFYVTTTLGSVIDHGTSLMTGEQFRWDEAIPGGRQQAPEAWVAAVKRITEKKPWGVTEIHNYKNFIYGSKSDFYKKYSDSVDSYLEAGVLPPMSTQVVRGVSPKMHIPTHLDIPDSFGVDVLNLNGALAVNKRFGDLRVVAVNSTEVPDADNYANALNTYWSDKEVFGKFALPKNAVTVVLGINSEGTTVDWARAFTGMPTGNEDLMQAVSSQLKGAKVDNNLLGRPYIDSNGEVVHSNGVLENIMFSETVGFNRVSMSGDDVPSSGFLYLGSDIDPTTGAKVWIGILWGVFLIGSIVGAFYASAAIQSRRHPESNYSSFRSSYRF